MNEFDLQIGAPVRCLDGDCGRLAKIALDPITWQVTDLIVENGKLLKQAHVFPLSTVIYTGPDDIHLSLLGEDLSNYSQYQEADTKLSYKNNSERFPIPSVNHQNLAHRNTAIVAKGTLVKNLEGLIGRLAHLMIDPETGSITHLVVQQGLLFPDYLNIPISFVESISHEGIFLSLPHEELCFFSQFFEQQVA